MPFSYSFSHLNNYKVSYLNGFNYRVQQITVDENNPDEELKVLADPELVHIDILNFYEDYRFTPEGKPVNFDKTHSITQSDIYNWLLASGATTNQCSSDKKVSEVNIGIKHIYKVAIICGDIGKISYQYFFQIVNQPGYFVSFSGNEKGKQFNLVLSSFKTE